MDTVPGQILKGLTEQARTALEELAGDLLREGIHSHSEIRQGAVAQMLVDVARQYQAGLIVIGTEGHSLLGGTLLGSVSNPAGLTTPFGPSSRTDRPGMRTCAVDPEPPVVNDQLLAVLPLMPPSICIAL